MQPTITFLTMTISTYGLIAVIGAFCSCAYCIYHTKKAGLSIDDMTFMIAYGFIGAVIGAKALYLIPRISELFTYSHIIFQNIGTLTQYFLSGFVFYGGLIGLLIGIFIYSQQFKVNILPFVRLAIPAIPLFHIFGRIGCFFAGCCYGVETMNGFSIPYHTDFSTQPDVDRLPIQLIEACLNAFLFLYLHFQVKKQRDSQFLLGSYLLHYACMRFLLEFLRGDIERGVFILSSSQWISLCLIPIGCLLLCHSHLFNKFIEIQISYDEKRTMKMK